MAVKKFMVCTKLLRITFRRLSQQNGRFLLEGAFSLLQAIFMSFFYLSFIITLVLLLNFLTKNITQTFNKLQNYFTPNGVQMYMGPQLRYKLFNKKNIKILN